MLAPAILLDMGKFMLGRSEAERAEYDQMFEALVSPFGRSFLGSIVVRAHVARLLMGYILGDSSEGIDRLVECGVFVALKDRLGHKERGGDAHVENVQFPLVRNRRIAGGKECKQEIELRHEVLIGGATPHVERVETSVVAAGRSSGVRVTLLGNNPPSGEGVTHGC
jgi:hypothetical protein